MHKPELITTADRLNRLGEELCQAKAVAVDTEFFWERTFYPILGLVQLAADNGCWLIDAVCLCDLRPLGAMLSTSNVIKVLHDAPQDLGILARATGAAPRTVFDTRLAAGFAGLASTCSLQTLLKESLGIELAKKETRSNWLRRPLSENQLRYAADDVLYLLSAREALLARCADDSVRAWLAEDLARLDDPLLYRDRDPYQMYARVKGAGRLSARQLAVLRELAAWRENEARFRDWPRAHVLPDDLLIAAAIRAPADAETFRAIDGMPRKMPASVIDDLLSAVARGRALPDGECPQPWGENGSSRHAFKAQSDRLLADIANACAPRRIDPALVVSRADADAFVRQGGKDLPDDHPLARGWRKKLMAEIQN